METYTVIDTDSIEIVLSSAPIVAEMQGKTVIKADIVIDKLAVKSPLSESSTYLVTNKIAEENIFEFDLVYISTSGKVKVATNDGNINESFVLGMALRDTIIGDNVDVLIFGIIKDSMFNAFALNRSIYLDVSGGLTDEVPLYGSGALYSTPIGRSLGNGEVLINIGRPLALSGV